MGKYEEKGLTSQLSSLYLNSPLPSLYYTGKIEVIDSFVPLSFVHLCFGLETFIGFILERILF